MIDALKFPVVEVSAANTPQLLAHENCTGGRVNYRILSNFKTFATHHSGTCGSGCHCKTPSYCRSELGRDSLRFIRIQF